MSLGAIRKIAFGGQQMRFLRAANASSNPGLIDLSQDTIRGDFQPHEDDFIDDVRKHRFQILMQPNPKEIGVMLPKIGFVTGTPWTPQPLLDGMEFQLDVDLGARVVRYASAIIDKCVIEGSRGGAPPTWNMTVLAKAETDLANWAAASATAIQSGRPYAFQQTAIQLQGSTRSYLRHVLAFDFHTNAEWYNSATATELEPQSWDVTLVAAVRYNSTNETLYSGPRDSGTRASGYLDFTATNVNTRFNFTQLIPRNKTPDILRRNETVKHGVMYKVARTAAVSNLMTVTHDDTP